MFPLKDDNPVEIFPLFTMGIIAACLWVWFSIQGAGMSEEAMVRSVCRYGLIPAEITGPAPGVEGLRLGPARCAFGGLTWSTLLTSAFLHGSWMHLIGNLWFLWIFGNNIEDSMGHLRFLAFYLLTAAVAGGAQIAAGPSSPLPMVGASGAISAIMGAYLLLYPRARVLTLFIIVVFIRVVPLPAWVLLGYWFVIQLLSGALEPAGAQGGVAFWAHVGGFVAGLALVKLFEHPELVEAKRSKRKLRSDEIPGRGWW